jgi:cysteine synthase B
MHIMEGWKHLETARIPGIYDPFIADEQLLISNEETVDTLLTTARNEGLLLSPSAAANLKGALKVAGRMDAGTVVTLLPDNGDKYADLLDEIL